MKKLILVLGAVAGIAAGLAVFGGFRVIVIQPIGAIPDGAVVIVSGLGGKVHWLDSADAICQREQGGVSLLCRGAVLAGIAEHGTIRARLPYSDLLFRMTGAPALDR